MATITSTASGKWSVGATWVGGVAPVDGDLAIIDTGHDVFVDQDSTIGSNSWTATTYAILIKGALVFNNRVADASTNITLTVKGHIQLYDNGAIYVGTENGSDKPGNGTDYGSVGPIPATRICKIYFAISAADATPYYHQISFAKSTTANKTPRVELWGAPDYQSGSSRNTAAPTASGTADSAADKVSFVDSALTQAADYWNGAMLEITGGTNIGEAREITDFDAVNDRIYWSSEEPMPLPCDNTTTYTLTHNYQRAKIVGNYASGLRVITLDRACDWQNGDFVIIGGGQAQAAATSPAERLQITRDGDTAANQIKVTLTSAKNDGDFCFSEARNAIIESITNVDDDQGFAFLSTDTYCKIVFKASWAGFLNCGATNSTSVGTISYTGAAMTHPIIRDCVARGGAYATTPSFYFVNMPSISTIAEDEPIRNLHVYHISGMLILTTLTSLPIDQLLYMKYKQLTFIESTVTGFVVSADVGSPVAPIIRGLWCDRGNSVGTANGQAISGMCRLENSLIRKCGADMFYLAAAPAFSSWPREMWIKNCKFAYTASGEALQINQSPYARLVLQNVRIENTDDNGIEFTGSSGSDEMIVFMNNCSFDQCNNAGAVGQGAICFLDGSGPIIYDTGSRYGTVIPNEEYNIVIDESVSAGAEGSGVYISDNCSYDEPTSSASHTVPIGFNTAGSATVQLSTIKARSSFEINSPIIDDALSDSFAFVPHAGLLTITDTGRPGSLPVTSNIKMKMQPYVAVGRSPFNLRMPLLVSLTASTEYTISVYFHQDVDAGAGKRPALHILGCGEHIVKEMSSATGSWEEVAITFTPAVSGTVMCWFSCCNTLNPSSATNTDGTPSSRGTVTVYADGFGVAS